MRRTVPGLLLPLLIVACGPDNTKEIEVTRQVLVNAHAARDAVSQLTMRYGEVLNAAGVVPGAPARGWEDVAGFRESAEGLVTRQFLSEYSKPVPVDPAFARAREIEDVARATAELVNLALEPSGTWDSYTQELGRVRSRFDRALTALETGTKTFIIVEMRTKVEEKAMAYSKALASAKASAAEPGKSREAARTP